MKGFSIKQLITAEINILFFVTPVVYLLANFFVGQSLYAVKDVLMLLICFQLLLYDFRHEKKYNKTVITLLGIYIIYIIVSSAVRMEDFTFWLLSIRELIVTPIAYIYIGSFMAKSGTDYKSYAFKMLFFTSMLTFGYSILFSGRSYGRTNRLSSFWDSEHEPAIIGGLLIVFAVILIYNRILENRETIGIRSDVRNSRRIYIIYLLAFGLGGYLVVMTKSRSAFLAIFIAVLFVFFRRLNLRNVILTILLLVAAYLIYVNYDVITGRSVDFNLYLRENQYTLAFQLILENPLFGIGIDKYGGVGGIRKTYYALGYSTTTMDSTLLKYLLNLGIVFYIIYFFILFYAYKKCKLYNRESFALIVFGLMIGAVTGKLSAYPINILYFTFIGYLFSYKKDSTEYHIPPDNTNL